MNQSDKPKVTVLGDNKITEYADGIKVIEHDGGHKLTCFPDGSMIGELGGGHKTTLFKDGELNIAFNFSSIKSVYPMNILNVLSVDTQDNGDVKIKEITFINGGKVFVAYNAAFEIISLAVDKIQTFNINKDGTSVGFDISDNGRDIKVN